MAQAPTQLSPVVAIPLDTHCGGFEVPLDGAFDVEQNVLIVRDTTWEQPSRSVLYWYGPNVAAILALVASAWLVVVFRRVLFRPQTHGVAYCRRCNYDLTGIRGSCCPECGCDLLRRKPTLGRRRLRRIVWPVIIHGTVITACISMLFQTLRPYNQNLMSRNGVGWPCQRWADIAPNWALMRDPRVGAVSYSNTTSRCRKFRLSSGTLIEEYKSAYTPYNTPRLSPDGRFSVCSRGNDILELDIRDLRSGAVRSISLRAVFGDTGVCGYDEFRFRDDKPEVYFTLTRLFQSGDSNTEAVLIQVPLTDNASARVVARAMVPIQGRFAPFVYGGVLTRGTDPTWVLWWHDGASKIEIRTGMLHAHLSPARQWAVPSPPRGWINIPTFENDQLRFVYWANRLPFQIVSVDFSTGTSSSTTGPMINPLVGGSFTRRPVEFRFDAQPKPDETFGTFVARISDKSEFGPADADDKPLVASPTKWVSGSWCDPSGRFLAVHLSDMPGRWQHYVPFHVPRTHSRLLIYDLAARH